MQDLSKSLKLPPDSPVRLETDGMKIVTTTTATMKPKKSSTPKEPRKSKGVSMTSASELAKINKLERAIHELKYKVDPEGHAGDCRRLTADEQIQELTSAGTFGTVQLALNPGNDLLLAQGSREARIYSRYRFEHVKITYTPAASSFNALGSAGDLQMGWNPETTGDLPTSLASFSKIGAKTEQFMAHKRMTLVITEKQLLRAGVKFKKVVNDDGIIGNPADWHTGLLMFAWEGISTGTFGRINIECSYLAVDKYPTLSISTPTIRWDGFSCAWQGITAAATTAYAIHAWAAAGTYPHQGYIAPRAGSGMVNAGNYATLEPGLYTATAACDFYSSTTALVRSSIVLYNVTGGSDVLEYNWLGPACSTQTVSGVWQLHVPVTTVFDFRYRADYASGSVTVKGGFILSRHP
mgnify:CR=1 FL=1